MRTPVDERTEVVPRTTPGTALLEPTAELSKRIEALARIQLSVVVPARDEERRLPGTLVRIIDYLLARGAGFEILVVDDGSRDATSLAAAEVLKRLGDRGRILRHERNLGKGASVRRGMLAARGERVLFTDADLSTPVEELEKLERALEGGAWVAIGSRAVDRRLVERAQPRSRDLAGRAFNCVVRLVAVPGVRDTQCGFKLFRREAVRPLFERSRIARFGFDVEVLALARRLDMPIAEVGVRWIDSPDSRVGLTHGALAFLDPFRIRLRLALGRYSVPRRTVPIVESTPRR